MQYPPVADFARQTGLAAEDEALLAGVPLFSGISLDSLRVLLADARVCRRPRHAMLFL